MVWGFEFQNSRPPIDGDATARPLSGPRDLGSWPEAARRSKEGGQTLRQGGQEIDDKDGGIGGLGEGLFLRLGRGLREVLQAAVGRGLRGKMEGLETDQGAIFVFQ